MTDTTTEGSEPCQAVGAPVEQPVRPDAGRAAFEAWYSEGGKWPAAVRRSGEGYMLAAAQSAWTAWQAARVDLVAALQWYADGLHFDKASPDAWDTVSGEPQNWWCDEAGTATVEDGSIAAMTLRGELTAVQIQALD